MKQAFYEEMGTSSKKEGVQKENEGDGKCQ